MKAVLAGAGARRALRPGARGTVLASMSRACYLDLPGGLVALVGPDVHPGPLHLLLDGDVPRVDRGAPVAVWANELSVAGRSVDLRSTTAWDGVLPPPPLVRDGAVRLQAALGEAARRSPLPAAGRRAAQGVARLEAGDLERAADLLAGLGPGLTPAGDDALAGALFAIRAAFGAPVQTRLERIVGDLPTGAISLAFLAWTARGQALAPLHSLLAAVATGEQEHAAASAWALAGVGASSGADFALGLSAALRAVCRGGLVPAPGPRPLER